MALPGLERVTHHPARPLSEGGAKPAGEKLARGHRLPRHELDGNEQLAAAELVQAKADFVVFGEIGGVENAVVVLDGGGFDGPSGVAGSHAVRRQESPQQPPRGDVLGLVFGELVAVDAVGEVAEGRAQREHGNLDHAVAVHGVADAAQLLGMDDVFGVVHRHDIEADRVLPLVAQHALVDPVQAVGFRSGTVVRAEGQVYLGEARLGPADRRHSGAVVGVGADEERVVPVLDGSHVVLEHLADDAVLVPQGKEDRGALLGLAGPRRVWRLPAAKPGGKAYDVEKEIVQSADQDPKGKPWQAEDDDPV
jgi:hypothetical protein